MIKDLRFDLSVASLFFYVFGFAIHKTRYIAKHQERYSTKEKFDFGCDIMNTVRRHALTTTHYEGQENFDDSENYVFYSNHQGKYDALGILLGMKGIPSSVLWDKKRADRILAREMSFLSSAVLIDLETMKGKAKGIIDATNHVKNGGNMLVFPEGMTDPKKQNKLGEFQTGCFAISQKTNTTIIPTVIWDSFKSMNGNNIFYHAHTWVYYLEPIKPSEYEGMTKQDLCDLVKKRIADKLDELEANPPVVKPNK